MKSLRVVPFALILQFVVRLIQDSMRPSPRSWPTKTARGVASPSSPPKPLSQFYLFLVRSTKASAPSLAGCWNAQSQPEVATPPVLRSRATRCFSESSLIHTILLALLFLPFFPSRFVSFCVLVSHRHTPTMWKGEENRLARKKERSRDSTAGHILNNAARNIDSFRRRVERTNSKSLARREKEERMWKVLVERGEDVFGSRSYRSRFRVDASAKKSSF